MPSGEADENGDTKLPEVCREAKEDLQNQRVKRKRRAEFRTEQGF